jgi:hypothetical protein
MRSRNQRLRRSRRFQLELLESRELLSAVGLPAHQAAEVSPLARISIKTVKGTLSGQSVLKPVTVSQGTASLHASGTGEFADEFSGTDNYSANKKLVIKYTNGVGILSDQSGDQINVTFTGKGRDTGGANFTFSVKGPVKGGAGMFTGAAGKFTATGTLNGLTGALSINYTVKFTRD